MRAPALASACEGLQGSASAHRCWQVLAGAGRCWQVLAGADSGCRQPESLPGAGSERDQGIPSGPGSRPANAIGLADQRGRPLDEGRGLVTLPGQFETDGEVVIGQIVDGDQFA